MARKVVPVSMSIDLFKELEKTVEHKGRSKFIVQAIRVALNKPVEKDLTVKEKVDKVESEAKMNKLLDDGLIKALQEKTAKGENPFSELSSVEIAKLMAQRSPKDKGMDEELESDYLSLTGILKRMIGIEDITKELSKTKGKLIKSQNEDILNKKIIRMLQNKLKKAGSDFNVKAFFAEIEAVSKAVKIEYNVRGLVYKGLFSGDK